jgi:hypothetical protein
MARATAASRCTREDEAVIRAEREDKETAVDARVAILSREEEE